MNKRMRELIELSRRYGADPEFVLAGGGNTSAKDSRTLWVKASGAALATIEENGFVRLDRRALKAVWTASYPAEAEAREAAVHSALLAARLPGQDGMRPSVETLLHDLFPQRFVVHTHPALLNGIGCSREGEQAVRRLFGDRVVWVPEVQPGWTMAQAVRCCVEKARAETARIPQVVLLQNHGLVVAADSPDEIEAISRRLLDTVRRAIPRVKRVKAVPVEFARAAELAPAVRMLCREGNEAIAVFCADPEAQPFLADARSFSAVARPFTPDHIVYCRHAPAFVPFRKELEAQRAELERRIRRYVQENGNPPAIVAVAALGFFACGRTIQEAGNARDLFLDACRIARAAASFGGVRPMRPDKVRFIRGWEAERYRKSVGSGAPAGRLRGRIAMVTGSAQGFGLGIAEGLAAEGAHLVIADIQGGAARAVAEDLCRRFGPGRAVAVEADVGSEPSMAALFEAAALAYGGLDVFVSNAGILRAGGLEDMALPTFDLMTRINYTAFFLGTKYAARILKLQRRYAPDRTADIIQVNSKSGLSGSKNNFAYAGAKFGGIGLVQSFALELVEDGIKVNAVCPGNYFDGPLWSDTKNGLFAQYLRTGKVPGATTVADVRRAYEEKVPMGRGCAVDDVVTAILYLIEQPYETGQALPVTGGQVMLR